MIWTNETCCAFQGQLLSRVLPPVLLLECLLGMLGNGGALWIFCFYVKPWKSSTVFLFNLALADFLLIVILPFRATYYLRGLDWAHGDGFCRIALFMLAMNRGGSILFLTAVAVDRYLRVVHPHHPANSAPVSRSVCVAVAVWLLTISLTAYLLFEPRHFPGHNKTYCDSFIICPNSTSNGHRAIFVFSFYLPLAVILFCTLQVVLQLRKQQRDRQGRIQRALHLIVLVAGVFAISFLPANVTQLMIWANNSKECDDSFERLDTAFYITVSLTYLNSVLDPLVYYFSSPAFKKVYRRVARLSLRKSEEPSPAQDKTRDTGSQSLSQL
ncbi:hydroxycarboxylic acid receptor 2-like [Anguilla anguilla]|uniref:hydroxycarboxylic acid receptor 2-like n=1 Tax=Anguilla anguilla TaxID=7936 RepID=UPI0015A860C9|nr:hydroxycarboxylic acid receptor 2-like [Anguilla anguilla]